VDGPEALLRRLTANDEGSLASVLTPTPEFAAAAPGCAGAALHPEIRVLVRLAALLAVDAPTISLRWAVELASSTGADDEALVGVLVISEPAVGAAQVVATAPRLALALGFDIEVDGWDGS
jgi:4-carboxymuconolactone decarboxylase